MLSQRSRPLGQSAYRLDFGEPRPGPSLDAAARPSESDLEGVGRNTLEVHACSLGSEIVLERAMPDFAAVPEQLELAPLHPQVRAFRRIGTNRVKDDGVEING